MVFTNFGAWCLEWKGYGYQREPIIVCLAGFGVLHCFRSALALVCSKSQTPLKCSCRPRLPLDTSSACGQCEIDHHCHQQIRHM